MPGSGDAGASGGGAATVVAAVSGTGSAGLLVLSEGIASAGSVTVGAAASFAVGGWLVTVASGKRGDDFSEAGVTGGGWSGMAFWIGGLIMVCKLTSIRSSWSSSSDTNARLSFAHWIINRCASTDKRRISSVNPALRPDGSNE